MNALPYSPGNNRDGDEMSTGTEILARVLHDFPEVVTINIEPQLGLIRFSFLAWELTGARRKEVCRLLQESIATWLALNQKEGGVNKIDTHSRGRLTMLELVRDLFTFTWDEVGIVVEVLRTNLRSHLIVELNEVEGTGYAEPLALTVPTTTVPHQRLLAFRHGGQVCVYKLGGNNQCVY